MTADAIGVSSSSMLDRAQYRVRQFQRAVWALLHPLRPEELAVARAVLPARAWDLFSAMPEVDRRHGVDVLQTLQERGFDDPALAQAALLHDCAKHRGGLTLMHWVAVVLLKAIRPDALAAWAAAPEPGPSGWRQAFWAHAHHPESGARLAAAAGCDPLAVSLIRWHQDSSAASPHDEVEERLLAALQAADDDN
jgi:hypothetical protein